MVSDPIHYFRANRKEKGGSSDRFPLIGLQNHWLQPWNQKTTASWQESDDKCSVLKSRHHFDSKGPCSWGYGLPSGHIRLWELDHKEGRAPKNWCLWTVVLEKTPKSPLDNKIKPVNLKGDQPRIVTGRTDGEAEAPVFWSYVANKVPDAGKDWGQKEKRAPEDEMAGWHHQCNGHELGQTLGDGKGQGSLACCGPRGCRVGHDWTTEQHHQFYHH